MVNEGLFVKRESQGGDFLWLWRDWQGSGVVRRGRGGWGFGEVVWLLVKFNLGNILDANVPVREHRKRISSLNEKTFFKCR